MSMIEESKKRLSLAFNNLENLIEEKLSKQHNITTAKLAQTDEMLVKANESLLAQNKHLQGKLFEIEKKYNELIETNNETSKHIDEIIANLKKAVNE